MNISKFTDNNNGGTTMAELIGYTFKVTDEQKENLQNRIKGSNLQAGEYLQMLVNAFDAQQHRETMVDDADVNLLDSHLARISEIYLSMAKNRADEKQIAQDSKIELEDTIKTLKAELFDLKEITKAQLDELRINTDVEIEVAIQRVATAEQNESKAIEEKDKAEQNELQTKRAFVKLEEYNTDLQTQIVDAKQQITTANQNVTEAQEQVKSTMDVLTIEQNKNSTLQAKNEALSAELDRVKLELATVKQNNESLLSKLDDTKELKNQALGELKAVHINHKELQETVAQQRITIDDLKQELWKHKDGISKN